MRSNTSTSWRVRGWITCVLVTFYAQNAVSKSLRCNETHYLLGSRCCKKCQPGFRLFSECTNSKPTICNKCNPGEYQPGWTREDQCRLQKRCDPVKGFMERPENLVAEEPCRCHSSLQCYHINCEYCEKIPICSPGHGLEVDLESSNGRQTCVACKKGFFSADNSAEKCKQWTNCKAKDKRETQPGTAQADAVCGPFISGAASSWVVVSVLSVITVLCLLILLLFCYKDKLKLLSVNLRSCVQNLKRTRIQQETLAPLYHSGAGGGLGGGPKYIPCETTKLICQAPHSPADEHPCTFPTSVPDVKVSLPLTGERTEEEGTKGKIVMEDQSEGPGEPEEVSEEEEVASVSPLLAGSCVCVIPVHEPLEVGDNEDCSQAVSPGTPGTCSCRGLDGDESGKEERIGSVRTGGNGENELCLPLSQAQIRPEFKLHLTDRSLVKQEELYRLASTDSTSTENGTTSPMTSVSPLMTSSSVGDLYLDKPTEASSPEQGQGLSWRDGKGIKLSSGELDLECSPESLHSQLTEPTLTSGQVSGSHNTTFISSGQVMNFSGDVIVVYVSQTSLGSEGAGQDDAFGSPVQEEANETALFFQSSMRPQGDSISQSTLQDETLPVQEVMEERLLRK
ncbi:tumor necrosis factor receptor superfamily member 11A [Cyclopterus lumpus]|uniref:tumor necrosis factor receptor superfamily member 11A n=1 Tax=Cyclopterus lumpus TaxID=8103 RepID=UPI0014872B0E|nr:tumor necrosis factor receptor superfamily member 11A [Cyclopterus lumpus]